MAELFCKSFVIHSLAAHRLAVRPHAVRLNHAAHLPAAHSRAVRRNLAVRHRVALRHLR